MESKYIIQMDESYECMLYIREQQSIEPWSCVICKIDEIKIPLRNGQFHIWDQYKLECGHLAHGRCYRKWCFKNECVGCPCNKKEQVDKNRNCRHCWAWGHPSEDCPVLRMSLQHRIHVKYRDLYLDEDNL